MANSTLSTVPATVLLAAMLNMTPAFAVENSAAAPAQSEPTFGATLPPIGYVRFCEANRKLCTSSQLPGKIILTPEHWRDLYQINTLINTTIKPISDQDLYGKPEYWAVATTAGDCEDYLLRKKTDLEKLGYPPSALLITVVLDEHKEGHAVLTVATEDGDYILDNRRNDILRWDATGYTFLKRQTSESPVKWVSLSKTPSTTVVATQIGSQLQ